MNLFRQLHTVSLQFSNDTLNNGGENAYMAHRTFLPEIHYGSLCEFIRVKLNPILYIESFPLLVNNSTFNYIVLGLLMRAVPPTYSL